MRSALRISDDINDAADDCRAYSRAAASVFDFARADTLLPLRAMLEYVLCCGNGDSACEREERVRLRRQLLPADIPPDMRVRGSR